MDTAIKWIGGASAAVALLFGAAMLAGGAVDLAPETTPDDGGKAFDDAFASAKPAAAATAAKPAPKQDQTFTIKRILPISGPIKYGEWHWDDKGVPAGPLVVTVDLEARVISVFRGGYEIGAAAVLLGTDNHPTPLGTFPIMAKIRHNVSSIYGAPMPYTLRLTHDGISIHASQVENGYASHGCIGTPDPFAAKLFAIAKPGDRVIITRGKMVGVGDNLVS